MEYLVVSTGFKIWPFSYVLLIELYYCYYHHHQKYLWITLIPLWKETETNAQVTQAQRAWCYMTVSIVLKCNFIKYYLLRKYLWVTTWLFHDIMFRPNVGGSFMVKIENFISEILLLIRNVFCTLNLLVVFIVLRLVCINKVI